MSNVHLLADRCRIVSGDGFRLADYNPRDKLGLTISKEEAAAYLQMGVKRLSELQQMLYAQDMWSVLVILQGMDAAGKDGVIKHVMSGVNPQGCHVTSFKAPSAEELDHDYLWRITAALPARGMIGLFNRSHYEELIVPRVLPEVLALQRLPPRLVTKNIWEERADDIRAFERHLARNGVAVVKVFLNLSRDEQKKRFMERLEEPEKHWKWAQGDLETRERWDDFHLAFEQAIAATAAQHAPWYVVPADRKWLTRLVVADVIIDAMEALDLAFPTVNEAQRKAIAAARKRLA